MFKVFRHQLFFQCLREFGRQFGTSETNLGFHRTRSCRRKCCLTQLTHHQKASSNRNLDFIRHLWCHFIKKIMVRNGLFGRFSARQLNKCWVGMKINPSVRISFLVSRWFWSVHPQLEMYLLLKWWFPNVTLVFRGVLPFSIWLLSFIQPAQKRHTLQMMASTHKMNWRCDVGIETFHNQTTNQSTQPTKETININQSTHPNNQLETPIFCISNSILPFSYHPRDLSTTNFIRFQSGLVLRTRRPWKKPMGLKPQKQGNRMGWSVGWLDV